VEGTDPDWSANGERIAYVFYPGDNAEIYTVRADGSDRMRLTNSPTDAWVPK
jgi:Tol biopolymer transport system component